MIISVYSYINYKEIILDWINHPANKKSGARKNLADALSCQTPFISHVLNGDYHFSPEQADACAQWMGLSEVDSNYFLLLVLWARAATKSLKTNLFKQIQKLRDDETVLKKKMKIKDGLSPENQSIYYSHWHYSAIHMALLIKELQTIEAIKEHFKISQKRLVSIIDFLIQIQLVGEKSGRLVVLKPMIHLEKESPLLIQHHTNWRLRAVESIQQNTSNSQTTQLNYSGTMSLEAEDFDWMKQKLSNLLKEVSEKIKDSKDEKLICFNFDCFEI